MTVSETQSPTLSADDFAFLQALLKRKAGIEIAEQQAYLVDSRLPPVARAHELENPPDIISALRATPPSGSELETDVIDAFTTNETSFFRDHHPFEDLTNHIVPELLEKISPASRLTIWCGASSSGQEPYTLAMMLSEKFPELVAARRVRIVATDLSRTMVSRTKEGRYSQLEVNRGLPAPLLLKYFEQDGREWVARPELRNMIETHIVNLLDPWPVVPTCDLVLLRNVLIYFDTDTRRDILTRIATDVLRPEGYLLLGSSETVLNLDVPYKTRRFDRGSCYQPEV